MRFCSAFFSTWPAKIVFVPKEWPFTSQVIMCKLVSQICEGDIPSYYSLYPNRVFYPFMDQLRLQYVITSIPYR